MTQSQINKANAKNIKAMTDARKREMSETSTRCRISGLFLIYIISLWVFNCINSIYIKILL